MAKRQFGNMRLKARWAAPNSSDWDQCHHGACGRLFEPLLDEAAEGEFFG